MDLQEFQTELTAALANEIRSREQQFARYTVRTLDLGVFPWHGFIELSLLTTEDACPENWIADWKFYNFTYTRTGQWPDVVWLATWMQDFYERDPEGNAPNIFAAAGNALASAAVHDALKHYKKAEAFHLSVFNPDDSRSRNYAEP